MDDELRYLRHVQLMETSNKRIFYDKLTFVYIELSKFQLTNQAMTPADKWIYLLRYMPEWQDIPAELDQTPFTQVFALSEEAALSDEDRWWYEGSLKQARVQYAEIVAAHQSGLDEGSQEKALEIARTLLAQKLDPALVAQATGLTLETVLALQHPGEGKS
jgi:predicted transposase/invertase (TIGR01784 family)